AHGAQLTLAHTDAVEVAAEPARVGPPVGRTRVPQVGGGEVRVRVVRVVDALHDRHAPGVVEAVQRAEPRVETELLRGVGAAAEGERLRAVVGDARPHLAVHRVAGGAPNVAGGDHGVEAVVAALQEDNHEPAAGRGGGVGDGLAHPGPAA